MRILLNKMARQTVFAHFKNIIFRTPNETKQAAVRRRWAPFAGSLISGQTKGKLHEV